MKIGWIGLGKLGFPCALTLATLGGHQVTGFDVDPSLAAKALDGEPWPHTEAGLGGLLEITRGQVRAVDYEDRPIRGSFAVADTLAEAVAGADIVFVAVQTPHAPGYDGSQPTPDQPRDFEYGYLVQALRDLAAATQSRPNPLTVAVVSTVLPGTCQRLLGPLIRRPLRLVYTPSFIAMGTTIADYTNPEFILAGTDDDDAYQDLAAVWEPFYRLPPFSAVILRTSVVTAETVKILYNTFLGLKLVFANAAMEVCQDLGADVDDVSAVLSHSHKRLWNPRAYFSGGMGDGGGCHPRDQLAMSALAGRISMSYDLFGAVMDARDAQTRWLADLACHWAAMSRLGVVVLGKAYKPGTSLTMGSPAALFVHHLRACDPEVLADWWDPHVEDRAWPSVSMDPAVFVVATRHPEFTDLRFPAGSVVIDPWRYIADQAGVTVVRVGSR